MTESIVPEIISEESPVPAMELAFFVSCAHFEVVIGGTADSRSSAAAVEIMVTGNAIFVAAFPSIPTPGR